MAIDAAAAMAGAIVAAEADIAAVADTVVAAKNVAYEIIVPPLATCLTVTNKPTPVGYVKSSFFSPANQARPTQIACV